MTVSPVVALSIAVGLAATIDDLRRRHIANWIPAVALAGGIAIQTFESGWRGALAGVLGAAAGFGVFLIFYLLGGMGGGDVKLMAGFGAILGAGRLLEAAMWTAGVGGLIALGAVAWTALRNRMRKQEGAPLRADAIPYAPAIAAGAWLSLVPV